MLRGSIPKGKQLHHGCERHACWNPDHLTPVTHAENRAYARKDKCKLGHPLSGANLYVDPAGQRSCRACRREGQRRFRAAACPSPASRGRPGRPPGPPRSDLERLVDHTVLELHPTLGSCWVFTGPANPYGRIGGGRTGGLERSTHRLGWNLLHGPIPDGMELHHRCERHACWNPDHLELATHAQNLAHARKDECKHGHPLSGDNLWVNVKTGMRKCRACNRAAQRAFRERHRALGTASK